MITAYCAVGISIGVNQQTSGLPSQKIDCDYRIQLLRDRLSVQLERSQRSNSPSGPSALPTLLRETQAACSGKNSEFTNNLQVILRSHEAGRSGLAATQRAHDDLSAQ